MPSDFYKQSIQDLIVIKPRVFQDERGFLLETYKQSEFTANGIDLPFVQGNHSVSRAGVVRGLHYQLPPYAQGKLVRVVQGKIWDVAVDIRKGSPTFGQWLGVELSGENLQMFWIPPGFAHGFIALTDDAHLIYQCTGEYNKDSEGGIRWDDPELAIQWPDAGVAPVVSDKDVQLPDFRQARLFD